MALDGLVTNIWIPGVTELLGSKTKEFENDEGALPETTIAGPAPPLGIWFTIMTCGFVAFTFVASKVRSDGFTKFDAVVKIAVQAVELTAREVEIDLATSLAAIFSLRAGFSRA